MLSRIQIRQKLNFYVKIIFFGLFYKSQKISNPDIFGETQSKHLVTLALSNSIALGSNLFLPFFRRRSRVIFPCRCENNQVLSCLSYSRPGNTTNDRHLVGQIFRIRAAENENSTQTLLKIKRKAPNPNKAKVKYLHKNDMLWMVF